jgi:hypothetical protein
MPALSLAESQEGHLHVFGRHDPQMDGPVLEPKNEVQQKYVE